MKDVYVNLNTYTRPKVSQQTSTTQEVNEVGLFRDKLELLSPSTTYPLLQQSTDEGEAK